MYCIRTILPYKSNDNDYNYKVNVNPFVIKNMETMGSDTTELNISGATIHIYNKCIWVWYLFDGKFVQKRTPNGQFDVHNRHFLVMPNAKPTTSKLVVDSKLRTMYQTESNRIQNGK